MNEKSTYALKLTAYAYAQAVRLLSIDEANADEWKLLARELLDDAMDRVAQEEQVEQDNPRD